MAFLGELMAAGKLKPVVERTYDVGEVRQALDYLGEGHARARRRSEGRARRV